MLIVRCSGYWSPVPEIQQLPHSLCLLSSLHSFFFLLCSMNYELEIFQLQHSTCFWNLTVGCEAADGGMGAGARASRRFIIILLSLLLLPTSQVTCPNHYLRMPSYSAVSEVIESFFLAESEPEYYSSIRKFTNPNPNIIRDFKKGSNIFESLKRFEYSNIFRII